MKFIITNKLQKNDGIINKENTYCITVGHKLQVAGQGEMKGMSCLKDIWSVVVNNYSRVDFISMKRNTQSIFLCKQVDGRWVYAYQIGKTTIDGVLE